MILTRAGFHLPVVLLTEILYCVQKSVKITKEGTGFTVYGAGKPLLLPIPLNLETFKHNRQY